MFSRRHSRSPASLREIYTQLTSVDRVILRRMVRERKIRLIDVVVLDIDTIREEVERYLREYLREMAEKR